MNPRLPALLLAFAVLLLAARGEAQREKGQELYRRGAALLKAGAFEAAVRAFQASYEHYPHDNTLYAIGETFRRLGRLRESHRYYTQYAQRLPASKRGEFGKKLDQLRLGQPSTLTVTTSPPGATVLVDGLAQGRTQARGVLRLSLAAGTHHLQVRLAGHLEESRELLAEFGEPLLVELVLRPQVGSAAPTHRHAGREQRTGLPGGEERRSPPQAAREQPWRPLLRAFVGLALPRYGSDQLQLEPALSVGLVGGARWRSGALGLALQARVSYSPVVDRVVNSEAALITLVGGLGGQWVFSRRVWLELDLFLGAQVLAGVDPASFLVQLSAGASGSYLSLALRPALELGVQLWRGLTLHFSPFALTYSPRLGGFTELAPEIKHVLLLDFTIGLGWN